MDGRYAVDREVSMISDVYVFFFFKGISLVMFCSILFLLFFLLNLGWC